MKNIITNAWAVTITLYSWLSPDNTCTPAPPSSNLIIIDNDVPIKPDIIENIIYNIPMSLAFVDNNHLLPMPLVCLPYSASHFYPFTPMPCTGFYLFLVSSPACLLTLPPAFFYVWLLYPYGNVNPLISKIGYRSLLFPYCTLTVLPYSFFG